MNQELTEKQQEYFDNSLHKAVVKGEIEEAKKRIAEGADVNNFINGCLTSSIDNGDLAMTKLLIKSGANPNTKNLGTPTPLCLAIDGAQIEIVDLLLDAGVDFTADKNLAMEWACSGKSFDIVKRLIERGADTSQNFITNIAHAAIDSKESYDLVLSALPTDAVDLQLRRATILSIQNGKTDVAIKLIEYSKATDSQLDAYMGEALIYQNKELLHHIIHDTNYRISPQGRKDLFQLPTVNFSGEQTITGYVRGLIEKKDLNEKLTATLKSKPTKTRTMKL